VGKRKFLVATYFPPKEPEVKLEAGENQLKTVDDNLDPGGVLKGASNPSE
jgi:hypothetical protein